MCGCRKNKGPLPAPAYLAELKNEQWGPLVWKLLHITAEQVGRSGNPILERDSANAIQLLITGLPDVLPCTECQNHARQYLHDNKFLAKDLTGTALQTYVRSYLFTFHNDVRIRKGQPILLNTPESCKTYYESQGISADDDKHMADYFRHALLYRLVNSTKYMRWLDTFRRLRLMLGY
jgi:hypothetical protein